MARSRRGELNQEELRRLQVAIASSYEHRILYQAGCGFAAEGLAQLDDDLLVTRVAERVTRIARQRKPRRLLRTVGVALAGICVASAAAAGGWVLEQRIAASPPTRPLVNTTPATARTTSGVHRDPNDKTIQSRDAPRDPAQPMADTAKPSESVGASHPSKTEGSQRASGATRSRDMGRGSSSEVAVSGVEPEADRATQPPTDVKSEFVRASRARRAGQSSTAIERYLDLARRFPDAPEAQQARLAAAELLLQRGEASRALDQFRSCIGSHSAEALWGEARALMLLNRTEEERQTLTELLTRFPQSAYAEAARQRLNENR